MRLYFKLTPNNESVPFEYMHKLIGVFHKWLGSNDIHDTISLYSLSWLKGGFQKKNCLDFKNGAVWFISAYDELICKQLITGALNDPDVCYGMKVSDITIQENPVFHETQKFILASPILIKHFDGTLLRHKTYLEEDTNQIMTEILRTKLKKANITQDVSIKFDLGYEKAKTKLVKIKNVFNKANMCPVIIQGNPQAITFAWNVGVGHSTGSGFGALQ